MLVQAGLCWTCSETTLLVFPRGGFNDGYGSILSRDKILNLAFHYENLPMQHTDFFFFSSIKIENFIPKCLICLIFLLKTLVVGTRYNRLAEVVLRSTHNLCFGTQIRNIRIPPHIPVFLYKSGVKGVFIARTCFPGEWLFWVCLPVINRLRMRLIYKI